MYKFQFQSVVAIGDAMQEVLAVQAGVRSSRLDGFYQRYCTEWQTAAGTNADAIRFRKDLMEASAPDLPRRETAILARLHKSLQDTDPQAIQHDLEDLYDLNVTFARLENEYVMKRAGTAHTELIALGVLGTCVSLFLGFYVRSGIAPRIKHLVESVRSFQDHGWTEKITDNGNDEIAVLANALDVGLGSIASRERDRDQFLAIVAHELKTPVTSIYGYAKLLLHPSIPREEMKGPLEAINRQSWRMTRLIDALFLLGKARAGQLHFEPKPLNISDLVELVVREMESLFGKSVFDAHIDPDITILGDEVLLEHAVWALLASATALSQQNDPIGVSFHKASHRARLSVDIRKCDGNATELQELFTPFRFVQYETGKGVRSAIGLYLCREIARVHNGTLQIEQIPGVSPEFVMDLPI